jgi:hypothetical protein
VRVDREGPPAVLTPYPRCHAAEHVIWAVAGLDAGRWSIEDTFRNIKQFLGGQSPQTWKAKGLERAAVLSLWLSTAVWLWYIPVTAHNRPGRCPGSRARPPVVRRRRDGRAAARPMAATNCACATPKPFPAKITDALARAA